MAKVPLTVGVSGKFELKAPWSVPTEKICTVQAIRRFVDLRRNAIDPFDLAYRPVGGTQQHLQEDEAQLASIVTLISQQGDVYYVPDTRIANYPNTGDYIYKHFILSVSLGALPESYSTAAVEADIRNAVIATTGIAATKVMVHEGPVMGGVTAEQHRIATEEREAAIVVQETIANQLIAERERTRQLAEINKQYEKMLKDAGLLPTA